MEKFALISTSNKENIVDFARELQNKYGYSIISTGGTAELLRGEIGEVIDVSEYTGFPELMGGRIKTLHPKVHGGILCRRGVATDLKEARQYDISLIDLVVVNLYPFQETLVKPSVTENEIIEEIDIGGVTLLRAAAKNWENVTVVCDPSDYSLVASGLEDEDKIKDLRRTLAAKAFDHTARYDSAISGYFSRGRPAFLSSDRDELPDVLSLSYPKEKQLRYGENPHQKASLYGGFLGGCDQIQGKDLSYNNILDASAAVGLVDEFDIPTTVILKHNNPCGVASSEDLGRAWEEAFATDMDAPFGGVVAVNREVDGEVAELMSRVWLEIIIAPGFSNEAHQLFSKKKNLRLLVREKDTIVQGGREIRTVEGGLLVQDRDQKKDDPSTFKVVTQKEPNEVDWKALLFAWKVAKHVKSNAIVFASAERTLGIGAGQMSRVDSARFAVTKAEAAGLSLKGSSMASDGLIPFQDGLMAGANAGATAVIQPGGSIRDEEVIEAANSEGMIMVFTGCRHFRH